MNAVTFSTRALTVYLLLVCQHPYQHISSPCVAVSKATDKDVSQEVYFPAKTLHSFFLLLLHKGKENIDKNVKFYPMIISLR